MNPKLKVFSGTSWFFDQEANELDAVIISLVEKIDEWTSSKNFDAIDIPSVRSDIAILIVLINGCGGGHLIEEDQIKIWESKLEEPFIIEGRWGFDPWPADEKQEFRDACKRQISDLRKAIIDERSS